tara:strand:- start:918 stop:1232 length:315 start_codon:yes stop_codon:yes gene_type:complete
MSKDIQEMVDHIISDTNHIAAESKRYLDALGEIAVAGDQANAIYLIGIARAAIDGASTTADDNNKVYISDINKEIADEWNDSSENKWHDTNAQVIAYDKSMEEE